MSDKFRRQLRQEAEQWRTEGLIDTSVYEQLRDRYKFNDLETSASNAIAINLMTWKPLPVTASCLFCWE